MTPNRPFLGRVASCVAFVSAFSAHPVIAQEARLDRDCTPHLTQMQQRLFQKAEEGPDALRNFIFIRRAIVQVDTYETAVWAIALSRARAACVKKVSGVQSSQPVSP